MLPEQSDLTTCDSVVGKEAAPTTACTIKDCPEKCTTTTVADDEEQELGDNLGEEWSSFSKTFKNTKKLSKMFNNAKVKVPKKVCKPDLACLAANKKCSTTIAGMPLHGHPRHPCSCCNQRHRSHHCCCRHRHCNCRQEPGLIVLPMLLVPLGLLVLLARNISNWKASRRTE